jgi:hypothetical protein
MANSNSSSTSGGGISFIGLLTIVFITLKLTGYITWSWWWVLSPIWISWIFIFLFLIIVIVWAVMQDKKGFRRK